MTRTNNELISFKDRSKLVQIELVPFLSLNSRINAVKMNILSQVLNLFRNPAVELTDSYFRELEK